MCTVRCSGEVISGEKGVCVIGVSASGVCLPQGCFPEGVSSWGECTAPGPRADTPFPVDRILDTHLWKHYLYVTVIKCLSSLVVWCRDSERPGFTSSLRQRFFRITNGHFDLLLQLVANVLFLSLKCMRTCFLLGGVNVTAIKCFSSLVAWCLDRERLRFDSLLRQRIFSDR